MSDADQPAKEPTQSGKPVIAIDGDEHNANWLRILAQRRQQQRKPPKSHQKEAPTNGDHQ